MNTLAIAITAIKVEVMTAKKEIDGATRMMIDITSTIVTEPGKKRRRSPGRCLIPVSAWMLVEVAVRDPQPSAQGHVADLVAQYRLVALLEWLVGWR
jgi:hypothetical protein